MFVSRLRYLIAFGIIFLAAKSAMKRQQILLIQQSSNLTINDHNLFNPIIGWKLSEWETVDDRIRGGSSYSYLKENNDSSKGVVFCGNLDTSTLGGAGFASQRISLGDYLDASAFSHLKIVFIEKSEKTLSLNLYNSYSTERGDGRYKSQVVYKASFPLKKDVEIYLAWSDFKPNYRGRYDPNAEPLNLQKITGLSIMMQSFFDSQKGPFLLGIKSISLVQLAA
jgi:hypothetical protein